MLATAGPPGRYESTRRERPEQRVVNEGRVLRITLAEDLFANDDAENKENLELLMSLSEREGFAVNVDGLEAATGWPKVSSTSLAQEIERGNPSLVDVSSLVEMLAATGERPSGSITVAQAMYHGRGNGELFVTSDQNLLGRRNSYNGIFSHKGIVDSDEAVSLAFAIQRGRGIFSLDKPGSHVEFGESGYFFALVRNHLPGAMATYRTALDPRWQNALDGLAEHFDALFEKYHSLLVALDDCGRMHLAEGYFGGGYTTLVRYRTIIHDSVVLLAGIMDIVAHIAVDRSGLTPPNASQISWRNLVSQNGFYRNLTDGARAVQDAALSAPRDELEFIAEVRHLYAHRKSIPGFDSSYFNDDKSRHYARYCVLGLGQAADERGKDVPEEFLGSFCDGNVQPFLLQRRITELAADLIERVAAMLDQSSPDWWGTPEGLESRDVDALLARRWWRDSYRLHEPTT